MNCHWGYRKIWCLAAICSLEGHRVSMVCGQRNISWTFLWPLSVLLFKFLFYVISGWLFDKNNITYSMVVTLKICRFFCKWFVICKLCPLRMPDVAALGFTFISWCWGKFFLHSNDHDRKNNGNINYNKNCNNTEIVVLIKNSIHCLYWLSYLIS